MKIFRPLAFASCPRSHQISMVSAMLLVFVPLVGFVVLGAAVLTCSASDSLAEIVMAVTAFCTGVALVLAYLVKGAGGVLARERKAVVRQRSGAQRQFLMVPDVGRILETLVAFLARRDAWVDTVKSPHPKFANTNLSARLLPTPILAAVRDAAA